MDEASKHPLIERAIGIVGTQVELAKRCRTTQQTISRALNRVNHVTAKLACAIDRATRGEVSKEMLRPDLFGPLPPLPEETQHAAE